MDVLKLSYGNLRHSLLQPRFLWCVFGTGLLAVLNVFPEFIRLVWKNADGTWMFGGTVLNYMQLMGCTLFYLVELTPCAMAASCSFCEDREENMLNFILTRSSTRKYTAAAFLTCGITAFLCMFFGWVLMTAFYGSMVPFHRDAEAYEGCGFTLLMNGSYGLFALLLIVKQSCKAAFFAMLSLLLSVYVKNRFAVVTLPVLMYYLLSGGVFYILGTTFNFMNVQVVYDSYWLASEGMTTAYAAFFTVVSGILMGCIFGRKLGREIR